MSDIERLKSAMHGLLNANDAASRAEAERAARELLYGPTYEVQADQVETDAAAGRLQQSAVGLKVVDQLLVPYAGLARAPASQPYPTLAEKTIVERKGDDDTVRDSHKAF